jgi:hypothetical protein
MRKLRWPLTLLLVAPLAGAFTTYQPPESGVELRLENFTKEKQVLASYWTGAETCSKPEAIGDLGHNLVTTVSTDRLVTISLSGRRADVSDPEACAVFFSFRPQPGYSYRASLQLFDGRCRLGFNKVELATNAASSAERILREYKVPLLPTQGICAKLDAEQRARLGF